MRLRPQDAIRTIQARSRYLFDSEEFAALVGRPMGDPGVARALRRLAKAGFVERITRRPSGWLIVPPEQSHYGAPPVSWWLNDCMKVLEPDYYVALLSAARYWGSSHYALQSTQVMISKSRSPWRPGKLTVEFTSKRSLADTPTVVVMNGVAPWRVSTREATLFDLVRHQVAVGGIESIARIVRDLGPKLSEDGMSKAASAANLVATAQRLGFILDRLQVRQPALRIEEWLSSRRVRIQPLELGAVGELVDPLFDARWNIGYSMKHLDLFEAVI